MKKTLIKKDNSLILVSDEKIKQADEGYSVYIETDNVYFTKGVHQLQPFNTVKDHFSLFHHDRNFDKASYVVLKIDKKVQNPEQYDNGNCFCNVKYLKKVLSQSPKLLKELADEIGWIDVEEGLWQQFRSENPNTVGGFKEQYESFKWCFQKAQELNQKKYTEEDMINVAKMATGTYRTEKEIKNYTKSISQPQQWQVEEAEEIDGVWNVTKIIK